MRDRPPNHYAKGIVARKASAYHGETPKKKKGIDRRIFSMDDHKRLKHRSVDKSLDAEFGATPKFNHKQYFRQGGVR